MTKSDFRLLLLLYLAIYAVGGLINYFQGVNVPSPSFVENMTKWSKSHPQQAEAEFDQFFNPFLIVVMATPIIKLISVILLLLGLAWPRWLFAICAATLSLPIFSSLSLMPDGKAKDLLLSDPSMVQAMIHASGITRMYSMIDGFMIAILFVVGVKSNFVKLAATEG